MFPNKRVQFIPVIKRTVALFSQQSLRFCSSHLHSKHMTFIDQIHLKQATHQKKLYKYKINKTLCMMTRTLIKTSSRNISSLSNARIIPKEPQVCNYKWQCQNHNNFFMEK